MVWLERAREARRTLVVEYWDPAGSLFRTSAGPLQRLRWWLQQAPWHYWWQAHALDCLVDGHLAHDPGAGTQAVAHLAGISRRNRGTFANDYFDDLSWLGLAALRAHRAGLVGQEVPVGLARAVRAGHDPQFGGFRWRVGDDFHNVPASAPAAMLLVGVGELTGDDEFVEFGRATSQWLHETVVDPVGLVWDGCRPRGQGLVPEGQIWSYNIGTVAGLDVALARVSSAGESDRLLERAARVVRVGTAALRSGCTGVDEARRLVESGVLPGARPGGRWADESGVGADPHLFRGILARYVADLVGAAPDRTADLAAELVEQAAAVWASRDRRGRISARWADRDPAAWSPPPGAIRRSPHGGRAPTLAAHVGGVLVLSSVARLDRAGLLP